MPTSRGLDPAAPGVYQIRVQGCVAPGWSDRMNGVDIQAEDPADGAPVTVLTGHFVDQTALVGVLSTLYDLGYLLLEVKRLRA